MYNLEDTFLNYLFIIVFHQYTITLTHNNLFITITTI